MKKFKFVSPVLFASLLFIINASSAQQVKEPKGPAQWSAPHEPFRIAGNLYYVGTQDLAVYLIATEQGHILINTGLANSAEQIRHNLQKLGFDFTKIRILLTTQAHYDHMGAMAAIQKQTGARFMVNSPDSSVAADGGASDYAFGKGVASFSAVRVDAVLTDGDSIQLGSTSLQMLSHPGHTKGSCSYLVDLKDEHRTYRVLIANMPSIVVEEPFDQISSYPGIAKDYAYTLEQMPKIKFDLWVASHASQFGLSKKYIKAKGYQPASFADAKGYLEALRQLQEDFDKHMKK